MKNSQPRDAPRTGVTEKRPMARFAGALIACKITELVLAFISMGLQIYTPTIPTKYAALIQAPFGAYIIIVTGLLLGHLTGERIPWKIDLFFTVTGIFIFVAVGEMVEKYYIDSIYTQDSNMLDAFVGGGAWILVMVMLADSIMAYKNIPTAGDG